jgi:hydrogenase nickel incorporation protein HypA/HybF
MHEMTLAQSIVDIVRDQARQGAFARVVRVKLAIGAFSYVEPHALEFGFEVVARGTIAEGATLVIERPPGSGWCPVCDKAVAVAAHGEPCPTCGGYGWTLVGGDEMRVVELEVE